MVLVIALDAHRIRLCFGAELAGDADGAVVLVRHDEDADVVLLVLDHVLDHHFVDGAAGQRVLAGLREVRGNPVRGGKGAAEADMAGIAAKFHRAVVEPYGFAAVPAAVFIQESESPFPPYSLNSFASYLLGANWLYPTSLTG